MGRDLLHLGFLVTVLQQLACPAEPCGSTSNTSLHAHVGETVSMSCPFSVHDPRKAPHVQWNYRSQTYNTENINLYLSINGSENRSYYKPPFKGRTWVNATGLAHGNITLHLAGVTMSDQGIFSCWVGLVTDCVSVEVQLWVSGEQEGEARRQVLGAEACGPPRLLDSASERREPEKHNHQSMLVLDCGLAATCFSGLVLSLAAALTLCV
ncbi:lens fiber membrane intrinsic protein isoform 2-T2 [Pangshura tecta]